MDQSETPKKTDQEVEPNTWSYYRVIEDEGPQGVKAHQSMPANFFFDHIDWNNEIDRGKEPFGFEVDDRELYLMHSQSFAYDSTTMTKIIDLVVVSGSRKYCKEIFLDRVKEALELKEELQKVASPKLINDLKSLPSTIGIIGRGSVFDPDRLPTPPVDIDFTIFVKDDNEYFGNKEKLQNEICRIIEDASPDSGIEIAVLDLNISSLEGVTGGSSKRMKVGTTPFAIDVVPFPSIPNISKTLFPRLSGNEKRIIEKGQVFFAQEHSELKNLFHSLNTNSKSSY